VRNAYNKDMSRMIYVEMGGEGEKIIRCLKMSPDSQHVASGDWAGNIRLHSMDTLEEQECI